MTDQTVTETEDVEVTATGQEPATEAPNEDGVDQTHPTDETPEDQEQGEDDTFPREYVEKLRDENARYRQRAQRADDLAHKLHSAYVAATGRLMDPDDLEFNEKHLEDAEALTAAIDELLARKPYLAKRTPTGNVGQGVSEDSATVDLAAILRSRT
ncbi:hypothetical protein DFO66_10714 [Brevibacterium sanguinis]|uniref:Uncharacterized protein n=2 Tax=Brevibacterium TaxID=1696 RepID=A0A366IIB7_9MICO|nr:MULTISPECIES: hypothetical protein [Brevibacterium]RBP64142.1 hypothetical protein DFO66_10714 [Brevibacterium sanguinis]RBP71566.1 hypothetical protein DFO65_105170 [Brevibacterium celere]